MVIGSLFSGAGLLDVGLTQAGHEHSWFVEREADRRALLAARWPDAAVHDDVRTVGAHNLERVDGIVGGFPCKGVPGAGLGTGLAHPETALWAEFARIVGELQPRWVLVENVARILTLHGGDVLRVVVGDLAALGFDVAWDCVRAADVGAPHGRDRWFAIAANAARVGHERSGAARHGRPGPPDGGKLPLLPTPNASLANYEEEPETWRKRRETYAQPRDPEGRSGLPLAIAVKLLPTPVAGDGREKGGGGRWNPDSAPLEQTLKDEVSPSSGASTSPPSADGKPSTDPRPRLSPDFVGWMMGTPSCVVCGREWTDSACPHSATEFM